MLESDSDNWRPTPKPSAIEHLIAKRQIGEMSADDYRTLVRQARIALSMNGDKKIRLPRRQSRT
jgi:hypothetical protein